MARAWQLSPRGPYPDPQPTLTPPGSFLGPPSNFPPGPMFHALPPPGTNLNPYFPRGQNFPNPFIPNYSQGGQINCSAPPPPGPPYFQRNPGNFPLQQPPTQIFPGPPNWRAPRPPRREQGKVGCTFSTKIGKEEEEREG